MTYSRLGVKDYGSFISAYAKFSEKLTFLPSDTHTYVRISGGKNVSFSKKFAYLAT